MANNRACKLSLTLFRYTLRFSRLPLLLCTPSGSSSLKIFITVFLLNKYGILQLEYYYVYIIVPGYNASIFVMHQLPHASVAKKTI